MLENHSTDSARRDNPGKRQPPRRPAALLVIGEVYSGEELIASRIATKRGLQQLKKRGLRAIRIGKEQLFLADHLIQYGLHPGKEGPSE